MRPKYVAVAILVCCCWTLYQAFAQERPGQMSDVAHPRVAELKQQVAQLLGRVERLELQLAQVTQITTDIGFSFDRPFSDASTDDDDAAQDEIIQIPSAVDEGMMIDAIESRMRR